MVRVINHFKVVIKHLDGTYEAAKSHHQISHDHPYYTIYVGDDGMTEKSITRANVVSIAITPVFDE